MTVKGLQRLLDILENKIPLELHAPLCTTFNRVAEGDRSLITEIEQETQDSNGKSKKRTREASSDESTAAMDKKIQLIPMREKLLEINSKEIEMDRSKVELERAKLELDHAKMDLEDTKRAKELAFIKAKAVAEAEAIRILESARANPRNEPERPAVLQFLPVDHTTIKKTYEETYPKFKTPLKKDEENFLNDARTRANRAFKADHGGLPPQQVREDIRLVDAFPKSWEGVLNTLAGIHRERYGHTQRSIHSFIHIQSQPVD